jgi:MFS family permease
MDKHQEQGRPLLERSVNASDAGRLELDIDAPVSKPKEQRPLKWRVYAYVLIAALANLLFGFEMSVISQVKDDFGAAHGMSSGSASIAFLASGLPIGAVFGSVGAGILQDKLGRRITLICTTAGYMGSVLVSFFADAFPQLAGGRLLTGVTIGIFSSTVPMYIAELSPAAVRGRLVTVNQVRKHSQHCVSHVRGCPL